MKYLITYKKYEPFITNWFDFENHFNHNLIVAVFDLIENKYTNNGKDWVDIEIDTL